MMNPTIQTVHLSRSLHAVRVKGEPLKTPAIQGAILAHDEICLSSFARGEIPPLNGKRGLELGS